MADWDEFLVSRLALQAQFDRTGHSLTKAAAVTRDSAGNIGFRVGFPGAVGHREFSGKQLHRALSYANQIGMVQTDIFDPSAQGWQEIIGRPRAGPMRAKYLETMAENFHEWMRTSGRGGGRLVLETLHTDKPAAARYLEETFRRRDASGVQQYYGILESETGEAKALRFFAEDGTELTTREIGEWANDFGMQLFEGNKLSKRLRAILSTRRMMTTGDHEYRVAMYDPTTMQSEWDKHFVRHPIGTNEAAVRATDGRILARRSVFEREYRAYLAEADQLESQYGQLDQSPAAIQSRRLAQQTRDIAEELKSILDRGYGSWNVRLSTSQIFESRDRKTLVRDPVSGEYVRIKGPDGEDPLRGVYKGDVHLAEDIYIPEGADVLAPRASYTKEAQFPGAFMSLEEHHFNIGARLDFQSLSAHPELFRPHMAAMSADMQSRIDAMFAEVQAGKIPQGYVEQMRERLSGRYIPDDPEERARYFKRTARDRQLLDFIDAGFDIRQSRPFMRQLVDSMYDSLVDSKMKRKMGYENLDWRMPDSIEAGIVTDWREGEEAVRPGTATLRGNRWVVSEEDFPGLFRALGGADLDDTVVNMIRYDSTRQKLVVAMLRRPGARGELSFLDLDVHDPAVYRVLMDKLPRSTDAEGQRLYRLLEDRNKLQREMEIEAGRALKETGDRKTQTLRWVRDAKAQIAQYNGMIASIVDDHEFKRRMFLPVDESASKTIGQSWYAGQRQLTSVYDEFEEYVPGSPNQGYLMPGGERAFRYMGEGEYHEGVVHKHGQSIGKIPIQPETAPDPTDWDMLGESMWRKAVDFAKNNELGRYSNARMLTDMLFAGPMGDMLTPGAIRVLQHERAIDMSILGDTSLKLEDYLEYLRDDTIRAMITARRAGATDVGFDLMAFQERARGPEASAYEKAFDRIRREMGLTRDDIEWSDMLLGPDHPAAFYSRMTLQGREMLAAAKARGESIVEGVEGPDFIMNQAFSHEEMTRAQRLERAFHRARIAANVAEDQMGEAAVDAADEINRAVLTEAASMLDDGVAGRSLYRAFGALMQRTQLRNAPDFLFAHRGSAEIGIGDLTNRALLFLREEAREAAGITEPIRGVPEHLLEPLTREMFSEQVQGRLPFDRRAMDAINAILAGEDLTAEAAALVTRGIEGMRAPMELADMHEDIANLFFPELGTDRARIIGPTLQGPLDPSAEVLLPDRQRSAYLGQLVEEYMAAPTEDLASVIRQSIVDRHKALVQWAQDEVLREDMPGTVRRHLARAMDISEAATGVSRAPGAPSAGQFLRDADDVLTRTIEPSGGGLSRRFNVQTIRELWETRPGRYGMLATGALAALGIIESIRDRDHTINDMQGPAFLPSGNPYTDVPMDMPQAPPPPPRPTGDGGGVTYEVRARGASRDSDLFDNIAEIINGPVQGVEYQRYEPPFRGSEQRDRILQEYR